MRGREREGGGGERGGRERGVCERERERERGTKHDQVKHAVRLLSSTIDLGNGHQEGEPALRRESIQRVLGTRASYLPPTLTVGPTRDSHLFPKVDSCARLKGQHFAAPNGVLAR